MNDNVNDRWIGVVEDRKDYAGTGRLKVRIVGIHPQDTSQVPTSSLPDAQTERSVATAHLFSGPREGDWVTGYFINGDRQHPIVTGVTDGLRGADVRVPNPNANVIRNAVNTRLSSDTIQLDNLTRQFNLLSVKPSGKGLLEIAKLSLQINLKRQSVFNLSQLRTNLDTAYNTRIQYGFIDNRSIAEINAGAKVPTRWDKYVAPDYKAGQPTVPQYARGIVDGSANAYSVRNRAHVCDIAMQVRYQLGKAAFAIQASDAIRQAVKALVEGLGINPVSAFVADIARKIAGYLRKILKILKMVNRFVKDVIKQVLLMKAIIEFIRALPDYLRKLFDRCLKEIYRELATFVFDLISNVFSDTDAGASDAFQSVGDAVSTASQVIDAANQTISLGKQLAVALDPDTPSGFSLAQTEQIIAAEFPDYVTIKEKILGPIL
jgi:hypothetical protein